jgi:hypothetical protein
MAALFWYLLLTGPFGAVSAGVLFVRGELHGVALSVVMAVCGIVPQVILLYSGYLFKRETGK